MKMNKMDINDIKFKVLLNEQSSHFGEPIIVQPWNFKAWDKVDLESLKQFTGFKDKHKHDIYYDDLIFDERSKMKLRVTRVEVACWIIELDDGIDPMPFIYLISDKP